MKGEVLQPAYLSGPSNQLFPKAVRSVLSEPLAFVCNNVVCRHSTYIISTVSQSLTPLQSPGITLFPFLKWGGWVSRWEREEYPLSTVWVRCQGGVHRDTCFVPFLPI